LAANCALNLHISDSNLLRPEKIRSSLTAFLREDQADFDRFSRSVTMKARKIVSRQEWLVDREAFLKKEKAFTRLRDELSRERRELPWVRVEKEYVFDGPAGKETLAELFQGRSQLLVYHFMFAPDWQAGCKSCSFLADNYGGAIAHLRQRDVTMVTVSKAPLEKLDAFKQRMGWQFKWVSSLENDFNSDYRVSFTAEEIEEGKCHYNYRTTHFPATEGPGITAFYKDGDGDIYHTYSAYARGLDILIGAYNLLDLVAKGRDEDDLSFSMAWVDHHDRYSN
jgi:predicted dithiol-disulfide oxidoreductase (DUF899 family)